MPKQRPLPYRKESNRWRVFPPVRSGTLPTGLWKPKPSWAGSKLRTLDVDCVPIHGHGRLAHDLGEARVGMNGHAYLLRRPLDQLGEDTLGDQVRHLRPYHVHPQDEVGLRVGDHLHEAVGLALDQRLADGPEGELRLLNFVALFLSLLPVQPERGNLRMAEGNAWNHVLVERHRVLAGHVLHSDYPLMARRMSQPVTAYNVACGIHA